jgi:hypothetical protein
MVPTLEKATIIIRKTLTTPVISLIPTNPIIIMEPYTRTVNTIPLMTNLTLKKPIRKILIQLNPIKNRSTSIKTAINRTLINPITMAMNRAIRKKPTPLILIRRTTIKSPINRNLMARLLIPILTHITKIIIRLKANIREIP